MGAVLFLALKVGICIISVVGVSSGMNWYNKRTFKLKGGFRVGEGESRHERLFRED